MEGWAECPHVKLRCSRRGLCKKPGHGVDGHGRETRHGTRMSTPRAWNSRTGIYNWLSEWRFPQQGRGTLCLSNSGLSAVGSVMGKNLPARRQRSLPASCAIGHEYDECQHRMERSGGTRALGKGSTCRTYASSLSVLRPQCASEAPGMFADTQRARPQPRRLTS